MVIAGPSTFDLGLWTFDLGPSTLDFRPWTFGLLTPKVPLQSVPTPCREYLEIPACLICGTSSAHYSSRVPSGANRRAPRHRRRFQHLVRFGERRPTPLLRHATAPEGKAKDPREVACRSQPIFSSYRDSSSHPVCLGKSKPAQRATASSPAWGEGNRGSANKD